MNHNSSLPAWLALAVIIVGLGSLLLLGIQPSAQPAVANEVAAAQPTVTSNNAIETPLAPNLTPFATATLVPTPTPVPPLVLPNVNVPEGGQVYLLQPTGAEAVGWAKAQDEAVNHFGDYNIYAGVFGGQQHVGAVQFDLATVPPGSPIIYADLTLTGLDSQWVAPDGRWRAELLASWIDDDWLNRNFHWLSRADSGLALLDSEVGSADIGQGRFNTFALPPAAIAEVQTRLFTGKIAFRLVGSSSGGDNLFAWDSGFGARSTGRAPVLRIVTNGPAPAEPPPSPTPHYVVITLTPTDDNSILRQAAERLTATAQATPGAVGTPEPTATATPLPPNWATPVIVTNTPVPENQATAVWEAQIATAQAVVRGTATATPPNVWTATATPLPPPPTATPMIVFFEGLTPTATPTQTPTALPAILHNKILFWSDRLGGETLMVMNPDGSNVAVWTGGSDEWIYAQSRVGVDLSPNGQYQVFVSDKGDRGHQLYLNDRVYGTSKQLTFMEDIAYDPAWSPTAFKIAFVSPEPGNDEIFVIDHEGAGLTRLTTNGWEWDKFPSWSPDGQQIIFWSNRDTRRKQIWVMNADGSNPRNLSNNEFNDWEPVWVR